MREAEVKRIIDEIDPDKVICPTCGVYCSISEMTIGCMTGDTIHMCNICNMKVYDHMMNSITPYRGRDWVGAILNEKTS